MKKLSEKHKAVLGFIADFIEEHSYPPTYREIGAYLSITPMTAHDYVVKLAEKGYLKIRERASRSIELIKKEHSVFQDIPIVGDVAAGKPLMSEENIDGFIRIHSSVLKKNSVYFAMKVRGDSMTGAGILNGDVVIIEKRESADNGQIVVAVTGEAVTLKRFFKEHSRIRLQSENPAYKPIFTTDAHIAGVLALSFRQY